MFHAAQYPALSPTVRRIRRIYPFHINAWVVLTDHMHCVRTFPPDADDYLTCWRLIKLLFSKGLPSNDRLSAIRRRRTERGIWQRRYWEHAILTESDYVRHTEYTHANPLEHGYVARVHDWPYSTFRRCVREGALPLDWSGAIDDLDRHRICPCRPERSFLVQPGRARAWNCNVPKVIRWGFSCLAIGVAFEAGWVIQSTLL